jgi:hypothetical protein
LTHEADVVFRQTSALPPHAWQCSSYSQGYFRETVQLLPGVGAFSGQEWWQHVSSFVAATPLVVTLKRRRRTWQGMRLGQGLVRVRTMRMDEQQQQTSIFSLEKR